MTGMLDTKRMLQAAAAAAFLLVAPHTVAALPITGTGPLGSFDGTIDYDAALTTLVVTLENTSAVDNGGFITAFAFNNPGNAITGVSLDTTDADFGLLGGAGFSNSINVAPYGSADIGVSTGSSWTGGGNPNGGIGVGQSATFRFTFAGTGLDGFTTIDFLSALSTGGGQGAEAFLVRFRGFEDGGSDKVPGVPGDPNVPVPEPLSLTLVGSGLAALAATRRRRSKA